MIIMVINSGSSSLKYQLYNMDEQEILAKGICERIGIDGKFRHSVPGKDNFEASISINNHEEAFSLIIQTLLSKEHGVISSLNEIDAVGHRVGLGGEEFTQPTLITPRVKDVVTSFIPLGRLHLPPNLMGIEACERLLPGVPQVAVFDTGFHTTIPKKAYSYSLPYELCKKHNIRKYGFHGQSHQYVAQIAAKSLNKPMSELNAITCHLGNGSSIAAIEKGKSIDTTMGFTALEGLVMGTRCGGLDPGIASFLMESEGMSANEFEMMLYKKSGLLGLSGVSSDMRDIEQEAARGNERAQNTLNVLCYQIKRYIGAYYALLPGLDVIVFTAGIGENSDVVRSGALTGLEHLGIILDEDANKRCHGTQATISTQNSKVTIMVIPTNEELAIARDTMRLAKNAMK